MSHGLYGVSYKKSPLTRRENIYRELLRRKAPFFATCNRIDYYGSNPEFDWDYVYRDRADIFRYLLRLACGLESALLGEREVMNQLRIFSQGAGSDLKSLIDKALLQAQGLRNKFDLYSSHSVADCVFHHAQSNRLLGKRVAILGSGVVAELLGRRFAGDFELTFVSGKNKYRARQLARRFGGFAHDRKNIQKALTGVDVVICATNSPHYVLEKKHLIGNCAIYDLAMPRNVAPALKAYDLDSFSLELEELSGFANARAGQCGAAIEELVCACV